MASPFDTLVRNEIRKGFKGKLLPGAIRRQVASTLDAKGDLLTGTTTDYTFEGIREDFSAFYKANSGIPHHSFKVLIIGGSISIQPDQNDRGWIRDQNNWFEIQRVLSIDPANATYEYLAFQITPP